MLTPFYEKLHITDTVSVIIVSIALMLICGFAATRVTKRLRLPNVTAYIVAGILIGPYCLNLVPGNVIDGMDFIADIALAFIAFSTGEFFKFDTLKKSGGKVMVITVFEAILASVLVFIITFFVLGLELNFSIVLAALASATAPASTVMTIRQTHAKGDFVDTLLQVVALDDVVGLVAYSIAISVALASATGAFHAGAIFKPLAINALVLLLGGGFGFFLKLLRAVIRIYVEVFRGTPMVLQAVFIFYGLPYFTDGAVAFKGMGGIWVAAIIVVSINTGAYMAESVRGGIISIDPGQTEGAKAIGMTHVQTMVNVIMPQALRNIIPQIGNNFIINIKDTSVMFVIGFVEFFATHRNIVGVNLLYFPSAVIEMAGYLMLTLAASFLLRLLEKRLDGNDNYELVSTDSLAMSAGTYSHPSRKTPFDERSGEFDSGRPKGEY